MTTSSPRPRAVLQYGPIDACQVCNEPALRPVLFLGYLPPVNRMLPIGRRPDQEPWFPAELLYCPRCHLVQLGYAVDPRILFPPEYPYTSGTTRVLRENFANLAREVHETIGITSDDLVVDIGSNDGTLLSNFHGACRVLGIEPSLTAELAQARGIPTVMRFFDADAAQAAIAEYGHARIVTATNVFAHIHNVHQVVDAIDTLLTKDGVFISESHYLGSLVDTLQYDTIYHEHLRYYSLTSLVYLLESHGFRVFHVTRIPTHGGSIRVYASKADRYPIDGSVEQLLRQERERGLSSDQWIGGFRARVSQSKVALYALLERVQRGGAAIYGIGAPSRASTLIAYTGLDQTLLECVLEVPSSKKLDKYMPGTMIPVVAESKLYADQPPYALLLSWHIAGEVCRNLKRNGYRGDFIVPLPEPHLVRGETIQVA